MATRAIVRVFDGDRQLVELFQQNDGDPFGLGRAIHTRFTGLRLASGLDVSTRFAGAAIVAGADGDGRESNGMGCFAAQLVAALKDRIGKVYLVAPDTDLAGSGIEYLYELREHEGALAMKVSYVPGDSIVYDGPLGGFAAILA